MGAAGPGGGAGGAAGVALVRARPRGRRHARAQPARRARSRAGSSRSRRCRAARAGARRCATLLDRGACPARSPTPPRSRSPPRSGTAPLMALHFEQLSLASLPANLARRAGGRADHVARDALGGRGAGLARAGRAAERARRPAARLPDVGGAHARPQAPGAAVPVRHRLGGRAGARPRCRSRSRRRPGRRRGGCRRRGSGGPAWRRGAVPVLAVCACAALAAVARLGGTPSRRFRAGPGELVVSFLDVGQGDATLIQDGGGASVLFDGGPPEAVVQNACARRACGGWTSSWPRTSRATTRAGARRAARGSRRGCCSTNGDGWRDPDVPPAARRAPTRAGSAASRPGPGRCSRVGGARGARCSGRRAAAARRAAARGPEHRAVVAAVVSAGSFDLLAARPTPSASAILALPLPPGRGDEGLPPRQRGPGPARRVLERLRPAGGGDRGRRAATTTATRRRARWRPCGAVPHVYRTDRDGTVRAARCPAGAMRVERTVRRCERP